MRKLRHSTDLDDALAEHSAANPIGFWHAGATPPGQHRQTAGVALSAKPMGLMTQLLARAQCPGCSRRFSELVCVRWASRPTCKMLRTEISQRGNPFRTVVEARNVAEGLAPGMQESFPRFHVDFFQRFQAIAGEAGAHHIDAFEPGLRHFDKRWLGVGLQPFGPAKA